MSSPLKVPTPREQALRTTRRQQRYEQYEQAKELYHQGIPIAAIARHLSVSRTTIYKLVAADSFPERAPTRRNSKLLAPHWDYLEKRWTEGCENASQLFREIQEQGYTGSRKQVARWAKSHQPLSATKASPIPSGSVPPPLSQNIAAALAPRHLAWLLVKEPAQLSASETIVLAHIQQEPSVALAYQLAQRFQVMVKSRIPAQLDDWIADCLGSSIPDMVNFADGVMHDHDAIRNALQEKWSNGQTEGQVTRLKMIKRKMYGRANFDLLKLRVLYSNSS
jgi:transposase